MLAPLLAWVPIAAWALAQGRAFGGDGEPLLVHYGIHVRCLIVIPLLVLAELPLHLVGRITAERFVTSGVVTNARRLDFDRVHAAVVRLRDASLPWVFACGAAVAWTIADASSGGIAFIGTSPAAFALAYAVGWSLMLVTPVLGVVHETVAHMHRLLVDKETLTAIASPMAIPFALLALASMPLAEIRSSLLSVPQ